MNFLQKITEYLLTNQVINLVVDVLTNFCLSLMKFRNLLTMVLGFQIFLDISKVFHKIC